jgi:HlyD family secretion protein
MNNSPGVIGMRGIFRQAALERLASLEQLDQLMRVVSPRHWLVLATCGALLGVALLWGMVGRLPTTVIGRGVLIHPRKVVDVQAPVAGRLATLAVRVGEVIKTGDVLGTIDQADIRQQLREERAALQELLTQDEAKRAIQTQQTALQAQQTTLEARAIELQRQDVQKRLRDAQAKAPLLQQRVVNRQRLEELGLVPRISDERLQAEQAYRDNQDMIAEFQTRLQQLEGELKHLQNQTKQLALQHLETSTSRKNAIQARRSQIALLEVQLDKSQITSQYAGRVLELTVQTGQMLQTGGRLGSIEAEDPASRLVGLTYFPIKAGKKIASGMPIYVAPDTVERERFGSILGTVTTVSAFPVTKEGITSLVGNAEVVNTLVTQGPAIEVVAELAQDPTTASGYKWSSSTAPALRITSGTTMVGRVVLEQRAPITYLLPWWREISGLH